MKVVIIGAGPVGMVLAAILAKEGIRVVIVDKRKVLSTLPRGIAVNQSTLAVLEKIDLLPAVMSIGTQVRQLNLYAKSIQFGEVSFRDLDISHPYFFHVRQSDLEKKLAEHLKTLGVEILHDRNLIDIRHDDSCSVACLETSEGVIEEFDADLIVGCDGGNSTCRQIAGIEVLQQSYGGFFRLADAVIENFPFSKAETHYFFTRNGYLMLVPAPKGETRVIASFRGQLSEHANEEINAAYFEQLIEARAGVRVSIDQLIWVTQAEFGHRVASRAISNRVAIAGDALHQFSPIGGTNMNVGIADAEFLAEAILSKNLDFYASARLSVVNHQIDVTRYLTKLMVMPRGMPAQKRPFVSASLKKLLKDEMPIALTGLQFERAAV